MRMTICQSNVIEYKIVMKYAFQMAYKAEMNST